MKLLLKEIQDRYVRENFKRIQNLITELSNSVDAGSTTTITNNTVQLIPLDGSTPISGTIVPDTASTHVIGSGTKPLVGLYADEVRVVPNTLYIDNHPAVGIDQVTGRLTFSSGNNQDVEVNAKGTGTLYIKSQGDINIHSTGSVVINGQAIANYAFGRDILDIATQVINGNQIILANTPQVNSERVILNGIELTEGVSYDYTRVANTITFNNGVLTPSGHIKVDYAY